MKKKSRSEDAPPATEPTESSHTEDIPVDSTIVESGRIPLLSEEALLEFGKELIKTSVAQSVEFHKTMLGLTATFATAMASIFGVVVYGSSDQQIGDPQKAFLLVAIVIMLESSVCFALGYSPREVLVRMQILNSLLDTRSRLLCTRKLWAVFGMIFFVISIAVILVGIFLNA